MLDTNLQTQLKGYLDNLKTPVELITFTDESPKAKELAQLATQIAELSPLITKINGNNTEKTANERLPSMLVRSVASNSEIRFAGLPMGHEFTSLVMALLHSGSHPLKIEADQIEQVRNLEGDFVFETYISLSCQNCPDVVQALNMMATINPNIKHTMIDGALFQTEVFDRDVMAVPSVYLNGESFSQGRVSLTDILNKVDKNAGARQAKALENKETYDFLVVGGGPAGAAAAIYAARKGINTGLVADRFGGQVSDTMSIENFISVKATQGPKLVASLEEHVREYDVDIMNSNKANKVKRNERTGLVEVSLENGAVLKSKSVVLATGARWREMNVPGENEYRGKGVAYCPHCDGPLFKGKPVAVIGGGNSGIEAAIDLAGIVEHVTVLEFADTLRADDVLVKKANSLSNVTIITNAQTTEVQGDGKRVTSLSYTDRDTTEQHSLALAGIFVQIGLMPNTEFLQGEIELTNRGEIIAGSQGETCIAGVFAAGDVTNSPYKQIIIAMGSGANAALGAFDYLIRQDV
ncbi:alkyl hydroperoxide reductase subunit F [Colwellia psychrerythraea]|uniref:Alkyl hydroperoxide reductase subunit F n=1 Tax=Colwellia psychrerythraea TaxID=28229 RepID=A0A099KV56_COLPS|nr:alkyl hydroperoxide reductase subunit F [Colwellia psychrerythraea]KGJ94456.1 alkyl hydroperoxide reductase, F subunit [Colwellia psychrerythraea]